MSNIQPLIIVSILFVLKLSNRKKLILHNFYDVKGNELNTKRFILSIKYQQHEYQIIGSSQFWSSWKNKDGKKIKMKIFKRSTNNLEEIESSTIDDLNKILKNVILSN